MINFKKVLSSLMICTLCITANSMVFAKEKKVSKYKVGPIMEKYIKIGNKDAIKMSKHPKLVKQEDKYVKIMQSKDKRTNIEETYTYNEYIKEIQKEQANVRTMTANSTANPYDYGWIKLSVEVYDEADIGWPNKFQYYASYEWEKIPTFTYVDIFAVSHSDGVTFDPTTTNYIYQPDKNKSFYRQYTQGGDTNSFYSLNYGCGFSFELLDKSISNSANDGLYAWNNSSHELFLNSMPYGSIMVIGSKANSSQLSTELGIYYAHQQLEFSVHPSLECTTGKISLSGAASLQYDQKFGTYQYDLGTNLNPDPYHGN